MTIKEIEEQKNLIVACQERLKQLEKDLEKTKIEKSILEERIKDFGINEYKIKDEIRDLERVVIAELDVEELCNELGALDSNPENVKHSKPKFNTGLSISSKDSLKQYLGKDANKKSINEAKEECAKKPFHFASFISTNKRNYMLYSTYDGTELVNGQPLYQYLKITNQGMDSYFDGEFVYFGFDEDFYKNIKVKITLAQMKAFPNLETAVMDILKRHEKAQNV